MFLNWQPKRDSRSGFTLGEVLVAFFIFGIVLSGVLYGYTQINRMAEMASMSLAAQSFASQGVEEAKSVQWNYVRGSYTNASSDDPFWTPPSVGGTNLPAQVDTLDVPTSGAPIYVTNFVTVSNIFTYLNPSNPPLRQITCCCIWTFPLDGHLCTNWAIAIRAPDE